MSDMQEACLKCSCQKVLTFPADQHRTPCSLALRNPDHVTLSWAIFENLFLVLAGWLAGWDPAIPAWGWKFSWRAGVSMVWVSPASPLWGSYLSYINRGSKENFILEILNFSSFFLFHFPFYLFGFSLSPFVHLSKDLKEPNCPLPTNLKPNQVGIKEVRGTANQIEPPCLLV